MRYERQKDMTALLSLSAVLGTAVVAAIGVAITFSDFHRPFTVAAAVSTAVAALAAFMTMYMSRRLARARSRRRVFLIYAREDIDAARRITAKLKEQGFAAWLDVDEIVPGQVWQKAVIRALEESSIALVLVSQHLSKKGFVQEELRVAMDTLQSPEPEISPVVPVRLDNSEVPERLSHIQWVNLFEEDGMDRLLFGLGALSSQRT